MTLPINFFPIYKYKAVAMNKSRKISLPISQCGKNTEGSLGYHADMRGITASSISYGMNPGQIKV